MPATSLEAIRRKNRNATAKRTARSRAEQDARPFVGCDGEGLKHPDRYALFRMGSRELYGNGLRLTTPDLLSFIVNHPPGDLLVGFAFDYDVSNILRDVPRVREHRAIPSRLERLFDRDVTYHAPLPGRAAFAGPTWVWLNFDGFPEFGIEYLPRNHLKVCLVDHTLRRDGSIWRQSRAGSIRTIFDVFGNFQKSFVRACRDFHIRPDLIEQVAAMKDRRSDFQAIDAEVRDYCRIECEMLAELMTEFRRNTLAAGIRPRTWNGAGKLASAILKDHGAMKRTEVEAVTPKPVLRLAHAAYYGGRFEVTRIGRIAAPVWEHDICSAYPAAMLELPCLEHGGWHGPIGGDDLAELDDQGALYVCPARFDHPDPAQFLCGLPFRAGDGTLHWPRAGNGTYWSIEIRSAERLGAKVTRRAGYLFERGCDCRPWAWVKELYDERRRLGKSAAGYPLKLGVNSLYGKQAQRIGNPTYQNPIAAGLITAITRSKLNDAIAAAGDPRRVVMIATDAIYTTGGPIAALPIGDDLGDWERKRYRSLFVVQPGVYWPPRPRGKAASAWKVKTRGLSPSYFAPHAAAFESAWRAYLRREDYWRTAPPSVPVATTVFMGLRHAYKTQNLDLACHWIEDVRQFRFNWAAKRERAEPSPDRRHMILGPRAGSLGRQSLAYKPRNDEGAATLGDDFERDRLLFEEQPNGLDLTPPFKED